jgi:hypothetical protein
MKRITLNTTVRKGKTKSGSTPNERSSQPDLIRSLIVRDDHYFSSVCHMHRKTEIGADSASLKVQNDML